MVIEADILSVQAAQAGEEVWALKSTTLDAKGAATNSDSVNISSLLALVLEPRSFDNDACRTVLAQCL